MKTRKPVFMSIMLAGVASVALCAVACGEDEQPVVAPKTYTVSFVTDGGTEIAPISAVGGSMIFAPSDPKKSGYTFAGWYTDSAFGGEAVEIPNVMPNNNVTYYAKFDPNIAEYTVTYDYNIGKVPHTTDISSVTVKAGESVTVADGNDYGAVGYMFMGWSVYKNGFVSDVVQDGQYNAGDKITPTDSDITLYAQWAAEYTDMRGVNADKIYVYEPLIGNANEAALLVRADKNKKDIYGVVVAGDETESGYTEFTFRSTEFTGGVFTGRLNANRTYAIADDVRGEYAQYDYVFGKTLNNYILELDGYGNATYTEIIGDTEYVISSGDYEYDAASDSYKFTYTSQTDEDGAKPQATYFVLEKKTVADTDFNGVFTPKGGESASFLVYDVGSGIRWYSSWIMALDGYGNAKIDMYNRTGSAIVKTVTGKYGGTDNYESGGEWLFDSDKPADQADFKFVLSVAPERDNSGVTRYYNVFLMCDETIAGTYTAADEADKSILYLDGYGEAQFISGGNIYEGYCTTENNLVTFMNSTGSAVLFQFEISGNKFTVKDESYVGSDAELPEFMVEDGVLVRYNNAQSTDIKLPDNVTEIADGVFMGMSNIKSIDLNNVVKIGDSAFYGCSNLETVKMTKVESLAAYAFANCAKLNNSGTKDVLELSAIKTVGEHAFEGCVSLKRVKLGVELEQIDDFAFYLCNVYNDASPLTIELAGEKAPVMGDKVTLGNIAVKFSVDSVKVAVKCFKEDSWDSYYSMLCVESGEGEGRGVYMSGSDMLVLDDNATYRSTASYMWLYEITDNTIKFYENGGDGKVETIVGTYKDGVISVAIGSRTRRFTRVSDDSQFTYKSIDGRYTLTCNPNSLRPENYETNSGDVEVTFNGKKVKLHVDSNGTKTIYEYKDEDGKLYDITVTFDAETLSVSKKFTPIRYNLTATDGSKITVLIQNGNVYIEKAEFAVEVDNGGKLRWTAASGLAVSAEKNGNAYTFSLRFRNTQYNFTVTASEDNKTFTYIKN